MTVIVHDNQIYGLTKGQASPTSEPGMRTKIQPGGVILLPFPPLETALALGCGFVARGYAAEREHLAELILAGINYNGFSLIDVFQPCVSFNKLNTFDWYSKRVYKVGAEHDASNKVSAMALAAERERLPIGIIYKKEKPSYGELSGLDGMKPLVDADIGNIDPSPVLADFR
jgi:2-oxoglutarate ferredoxin oxidoreductase subunit beta